MVCFCLYKTKQQAKHILIERYITISAVKINDYRDKKLYLYIHAQDIRRPYEYIMCYTKMISFNYTF